MGEYEGSHMEKQRGNAVDATARSPLQRLREAHNEENRRGLGRLLLFLSIMVTWVPAAFLIEWLIPQSVPGIFLWAGYAIASILLWQRYLYRRYGTTPWVVAKTK
jgi:hypothetical protein